MAFKDPEVAKAYLREWRRAHPDYGREKVAVEPLAAFDLTDPEQLARACHFSNLQPLWWRVNLSKGGPRRASQGVNRGHH